MYKYIKYILLIGILNHFFFYRIDITKLKKFSLSNYTKQTMHNMSNHKIDITILLDGDMTNNYKKLKYEIKYILEEFKNLNNNIKFKFTIPSRELIDNYNLLPIILDTDYGYLEIYPYAILKINNKIKIINFLKTQNKYITNKNDIPIESIEKIEYNFIYTIDSMIKRKNNKLGILQNHKELNGKEIIDLKQVLSKRYEIDNINIKLKNIDNLIDYNIENLKNYNAIIINKPRLAFNEKEKFILDQYIMNGGNMILCIDKINSEMDSIYRSGKILPINKYLNLDDLLFNMGIKIHNFIVKDYKCAPITLSDGNIDGNYTYNYYNWPYFILSNQGEENIINNNINNILLRFCNPIEILDNNLKKTILLHTSINSDLISPYKFITLDEVNNNNSKNLGYIPLAVLIEGNIKSAYKNRYESIEYKKFKNTSENSKIIVISDGDIFKNDILRGEPMEIGENKYSILPNSKNINLNKYDNKIFLENCIDYITNNQEIINLRNKKKNNIELNIYKVKLYKKELQRYTMLFHIIFNIISLIISLLIRKVTINRNINKIKNHA